MILFDNAREAGVPFPTSLLFGKNQGIILSAATIKLLRVNPS
jgi:hypothetical protein